MDQIPRLATPLRRIGRRAHAIRPWSTTRIRSLRTPLDSSSSRNDDLHSFARLLTVELHDDPESLWRLDHGPARLQRSSRGQRWLHACHRSNGSSYSSLRSHRAIPPFPRILLRTNSHLLHRMEPSQPAAFHILPSYLQTSRCESPGPPRLRDDSQYSLH